MTDVELLAGVSNREQAGLPTTRVVMSERDYGELRRSVLAHTRRSWWQRLKSALTRPRPSGLSGNVFNVDIWVDQDIKEPMFE